MDTNESVVEARWATYKGGVDITLITEARWESLKQRAVTAAAQYPRFSLSPCWAISLLQEFPSLRPVDLDQLCGELYSASAQDGNLISGEDIRLAAELLRKFFELK